MPTSNFTRPIHALRTFALSFPETTEDHPWGESAFKVKGKVFVFVSVHEGRLQVTVKLPTSSGDAVALPFVEPAGYGMGKHGWVTATFGGQDAIPLNAMKEWIVESFRAVAPKKLAASVRNGTA